MIAAINDVVTVLLRDQKKGELVRFYSTQNRNLNFPANMRVAAETFKDGDPKKRKPLRHSKTLTQEKRSLNFA